MRIFKHGKSTARPVHRQLAIFLSAVMLIMSAVPAMAADSGAAADQTSGSSATAGTQTSDTSAAAGTATPAAGGITVYVNGTLQQFDTEPVIVADSTFVPMRRIFETLGADVEWNADRRDVYATIGFNEISLKIGSLVAISNAEVTMLNAAPYISDSRTMVPLRFLSESLGYNVKWDGATRRIDIDSPAASSQAASGTAAAGSSAAAGSTAAGSTSAQTSSAGTGTARSILGDTATLTYNDAIKKAIRNSSACKTARLSLSQADQQKTEFYNMYSENYELSVMQSEKSLNLLASWTEKNVVVTEEQTAYTVKNDMDAVSLKLVDIENQKEALTYAQKQYDTAQIQYEAGAISAKALQTSKSAVTTAQQTLDSYQTQLEGLNIKVCGEIGESCSGTLIPEFNLDYKPVGDVNMLQAYNDSLNNDPYIWYVENAARNAQFNLQTYEYNYGSKSYALTKLDLEQAQANLDSTKSNLMNALYTRYNVLNQLESAIGLLADQQGTLRDNIDTQRIAYENGSLSRNAFESTLQNARSITYNMLTQKVSHSQADSIFVKPYLAPTYMVAGSSSGSSAS